MASRPWLVSRCGTSTQKPRAVFSALTHRLLSKWTPQSSPAEHLLVPLNNVLRTELLPALIGRPPPNDLESSLFDLPCSKTCWIGYAYPHEITFLTRKVYDILNEQIQKRAQVSRDNRHRCQDEADDIHQQLSKKLQKAVDLAKQKGASSWLTSLPLT